MGQYTRFEAPIPPTPIQQPSDDDAMDVCVDDADSNPTSSNTPTLSNSPILTSTLSSNTPSPPSATTQFSSKRGLSLTWRSAGDVAQQYSLSEPSVQLLSDLFSTSLSILNGERAFVDILQTMVRNIYQQSVTASTGTNVLGLTCANNPISLGAIAYHIKRTDKKGIMLEYDLALSFIQFAIKLDVLREERGVNSTMDVIRKEMECGGSLWSDEGIAICSEFQARDWRQCGYQLAEFAGAGKQCF
jgi:hypothetical protein